MKKLIFAINLLLYITDLSAQNIGGHASKPPLDTSVFGKWPSIGEFKISNNGQYALYIINNRPVHNHTLVIQALNRDWRNELLGATGASFTDDSRRVLFVKGRDTLCLLDLKENKVESIPHVQSYKLVKGKEAEWLAYHLHVPGQQLILRNMKTGRKLVFDGVTAYRLHKGGNGMLIKREVKGSNILRVSTTLTWVTLPFGKETDIWKGIRADNFIFDNSGSKLAFMSSIADDNTKSKENLLWIYKEGMNNAIRLMADQITVLQNGHRISTISHFSKDGELLFFKADAPDFAKPAEDAVMVDIWSYMDTVLQSQQLKELDPSSMSWKPHNYLYAVNINDGKLVRLQYENEAVALYNSQLGALAFVSHNQYMPDAFWSEACQPAYYISLIRSRLRRQVKLKQIAGCDHIAMSPNGDYLLLTDEKERDIYSYDIKTGKERNLTKDLPAPFESNGKGAPHQYRRLKIAAWLTKGASVLIYDQYDIWQIDPSGKQSPKCLTDRYGYKNKIIFRLLEEVSVFSDNLDDYIIHPGEKILLRAFDTKNSNNGFYKIIVGREAEPQKLIMDANVYFISDIDIRGGRKPVKAADVDIWLVRKESTSQSPNLFVTSNFKEFSELSHIYPERKYNWMTSELITFKRSDGQYELGVIYKPENFDSSKKYPVIFHYYEELSQHANAYHQPEATTDNLNIPWFVSQGYIVFTPNIHYTYGFPGQSALNAVVGAAKHMTMLPWIDSSRMGIQGHSFGGYETNYIITHTNMFTAAMSSAGESDIVSAYNSLFGGAISGSYSYQGYHERSQYRLGCSLWENPEIYIRNSPIFYANRVTTPLLMMHNKLDGAVDFSQGVEFFTALRRLGKRVWMLQYDGETHVIINERAAKLHTILVTQFFDHYLRKAPAPAWMTRGIPAYMKGISYGLELDARANTLEGGAENETE